MNAFDAEAPCMLDIFLSKKYCHLKMWIVVFWVMSQCSPVGVYLEPLTFNSGQTISIVLGLHTIFK
jgi:hypothetical protein